MLQLLFTLLFAEGFVVILLLFTTPLRNLVLSGLDKVKRGHGPIVIKSICGTVSVVLASTVYSAVEIQRRAKSEEVADLSTTDQVLFGKHLLDASLMGFILFLALLIDRLHYYIRELGSRRKAMEVEAGRKSESRSSTEEDAKAREQQVETFKEMIRHLERELQGKIMEANASEANVVALRKQCEGLLSEYDRLLGENQELRDQLRDMDQRYSRSPTKKDS